MTATLTRALVALPSTALGGTERHTAALADAFAAAGVAVTVALEPALEAGFAGMLGRPGAVQRLAAPLGWQPEASVEANMAAQEAALAVALAATRPDLVILPLPWPTHGLGLFRGLVAAGQRALVIHHLAPREPQPSPPAAVLAVLGALPTAPFHWAAVSAPVAARSAAILGVPEAGFTVVPNGVPVPPDDPACRAAARLRQRHRLGLPPEAKLLVFAGRLEVPKGADLLPEIAGRLARDCDATLVALGEGSLRGPLGASRAGRHGGPLRLMGHVDDVPDWLLAADALLLPSRLEGCPLIFLEAAARRCPVIASGDALEAYGAEATRLAALAPGGGVAHLTDQAAVRLYAPKSARAAVDAAYRTVFALDEAAMLRCYFSLARSSLV